MQLGYLGAKILPSIKTLLSDILFRMSQHKNFENVLDWEITVPDWPKGGLHTHP